MTNTSERKTLNFIFDTDTYQDEFRASNLKQALRLFNGDDPIGRETFIDTQPDETGYLWTPPYNIVVHEVEGLDNFVADFDNGESWCFVLLWLYPYLRQPHLKDVMEHLNYLQGRHRGVSILADYGHESHVPGSMGFKFLAEHPHFDTNRYLHCTISLKNDNMAHYNKNMFATSGLKKPPKFRQSVETFHYVTGMMPKIGELNMEGIKGTLYTRKGDGAFVNNRNQLEYKYLIPNRLGRKSRRELIVALDNRGLLEDSEWSMVYPNGNPDLPWDYDDEYKERFGNHTKTMSRPYNVWSGAEECVYPDQSVPTELLRNAMCYVALETYPTYFDNDELNKPLNFPLEENAPFTVLDASEKSIKPFIYGLVPFIYGRKGLVDRWRELGMWLPGDYGNEECHIERMEAMIDAMEDFTNNHLPISKDTIEKLLDNQRIILSLHWHWKVNEKMFHMIANDLQ